MREVGVTTAVFATTEALEFTWRAALSQLAEEGSQLEGLLLCRRCLLAAAKLHGLQLGALRGQPGGECSPENSARLAGCVTTSVALPPELAEAVSEPAAVQAVWLSLTVALSRAWRAGGHLRHACGEERQAAALLSAHGLHDAATALVSHSADLVAAEGWADALCDARGVQLLALTSSQAAAALLAFHQSKLVALRALACSTPRHGDEQVVDGSAVLWVLPLRCWEAVPEATLHVHVVNTGMLPILATQLRAHLAPTAGGRTLVCEHSRDGGPGEGAAVELASGETRLQFTVSQAALAEAQPGHHVLAFLSVVLEGGLSLVARPRRWLQPPHRRGAISPPLFGASTSVVAPAAGGPQPPGTVVLDVPSQEAAAVDVSLVLPHSLLLTHGPEAHAWQWLGVRVHVDAPLQGATLALSGGAGLHVPLDQPCWAWRQGSATLLHAPLEEGTLALPEMRSGHALVVWLRVQVVGDGRARRRLGAVVRRPGAESVVHMFAKTLSAHAVAPFTAAVSHVLTEPTGGGGGGPRAVLHVRLESQLPHAVVVTAAQLQHASATAELQAPAQVVVEPGQPCGFVWTMSPVDGGRSGSTPRALLQVLYTHDAAQRLPVDAFGADLLPSIGGQSGTGGIPWSCAVELPLLPSWQVTCSAPPVGCVGQRLRFSYAVKRVVGASLDAAPAQATEDSDLGGAGALHWQALLCSRHWIPLGPAEGQVVPPLGGDTVLVWLECVPLVAGEWSAPQLQLLPRDAAHHLHVWHVPAAPHLVRVLPGYGAPGYGAPGMT